MKFVVEIEKMSSGLIVARNNEYLFLACDTDHKLLLTELPIMIPVSIKERIYRQQADLLVL